MFMHKRDKLALGMLTQEHGNKHWLIAYYSLQVASVAHVYFSCLKGLWLQLLSQ